MSYNDERSDPNASNYPNTGSTAANPRAPQPNPKDPNLPHEPTGPVTSDSLAAESLSSGGAFADNENIQRMAAKGASSTLTNTDTSAATELQPAPDAAQRDGNNNNNDHDQKLRYPEDAGGKPMFSGAHSQHGYVGGPSSAKTPAKGEYVTGLAPKSSSTDDTTTTTGTTSGEDYRANAAAAETAPTAFGNFRSQGQLKPKGKNLVEGDMPSTKTFTGDVGGPHDPGRVAEQEMLKKDADVPGQGEAREYGRGVEKGEGEGGSSGRFDVLESERA